MKVRCTGPLESDLRDEVGVPAFMHPVVVGVEYTVWAMALMNVDLVVMVLSEDGWPTWVPLKIFSIVSEDIPSGWKFAVRDGFIGALWGYPSLIQDRNHVGDLCGRREVARKIFLRESGVSGFNEQAGKFIE